MKFRKSSSFLWPVCVAAVLFSAMWLWYPSSYVCAAPAGTASQVAPDRGVHVSEPLLDLSSMFPRPLRRQMFGVAVWQCLVSFIFVLLGFVGKKVWEYILDKRILAFLRTTRVDFDHKLAEAAGGPIGYLILIVGLLGACAVLSLPQQPVDVRRFVFTGLKICVIADAVWFLFRLVDVASEYLMRITVHTESTLDDQLVPLLRKALKVTVALIGAVTAMTILGINVAGVVAGLGIGGLAVALGLQDTLANFFGSVFIFLDRPFGIGDQIVIGDVEGIVTEVGFRSTRIQTFPKTLVTIPNKTVANATINNISHRPKRRVVQTIGLTYDTTAEQMARAVETIRNVVSNTPGVDKEFIVVHFDEFADSSLNVIVYYFTENTGFEEHKATKERVNLAIMNAIEQMGLSIAFPTRTIYIENDTANQQQK
ncbi:MAG: mechanosensitive ion channel family protein [Candidatus Hydrogenedentes bacterium]|nr:mechanosensitive ion channel family protein [Candidatus Hydrogenedentota bacterium]